MNTRQALRAIEELRKGIPPVGFVEHFTVGRKSEIRSLEDHLQSKDSTVLLLKANWGSGKSHLLRLIREKALRLGYAVSYVQLDAKSGVRFNRMDQILGAILRSVEVPQEQYPAGLRGLLDFISNAAEVARRDGKPEFWTELTNDWTWDFSEVLSSSGFFVALRAWMTGEAQAQEMVVDWLLKSENYRAQRKVLYTGLVSDLRPHFRDPRPDYQFYQDDVFLFFRDDYRQSWDTLADINTLLQQAGLSGLIVLFDEFEDVLTNLSRIDYQEKAFWNLFLFFSGKRFPGMTFYAVTPGFAEKCKGLLLDSGRFDFDYSRFDHLPTFEMSPLEEPELQELAVRIAAAHAIAYSYAPPPALLDKVRRVVTRESRSPVQDRARQTIREVVKTLDDAMEAA